MAAITATEITYTLMERMLDTPGRIRRKFTVSFPTGANAGTNNQYVTGGIALDQRALGCRLRVQRLLVIGMTPVAGNNNPDWFWNGSDTAPKLVGFGNGAAGAPDAELANTVVLSGPQALVVEVEGY